MLIKCVTLHITNSQTCNVAKTQMFEYRDANVLRLPVIDFEMPITDLVLDLEKLRYKFLDGDTHELVFEQIRRVFQMLESIGSTRIEGNNTTIMDYVETTKIQERTYPNKEEEIREILNIEEAMRYIEDNINDISINTLFVRELHQLAVKGLSYKREGAMHPGEFRMQNVRIGGSSHTPPDYTQVEPLMQELMGFVRQESSAKYDLLKIAIAHHRFVWIHPFENGNGRVVRLFTYALLLKNVFKSRDRIINPTAVFCSDRDAYYHYLSMADKGTDEGLISWAEYMLRGLRTELEKIDKLSNYAYLKNNIILPALQDALEHMYINHDEYSVLKQTISGESQTLQSSDLVEVFPSKNSSERSRIISRLLKKNMLRPIREKARKYVISFNNNYLLRSILKSLGDKGFLPTKDF